MKMEPNGGNVYKPHKLMISSGEFWRCAHGKTGLGWRAKWKGCLRCALSNLKAYMAWRRKEV